MAVREGRIYRFADVQVDTARGCITRGGDEKHLRKQTFQVLLYLLEQQGRLVTKEELIAHIWKDTAVTDDALVQCIGEARKALGDDRRNPRFIKTTPKAGYRFITPLEPTTVNITAPTIATKEITTIEFEYEEEFDKPSVQNLVDALSRRPLTTRIINRPLLIASVAVCVLIVVSFAIYLRTSSRAPDETAVSLPRIPGRLSVAVVYFDNQSSSAELDWLREGLADGKTRRKCGSTTSAKQGPASMYQSMTDALIVLNH